MHHELLKLHKAALNTATDPVLIQLHESAMSITESRLRIRDQRYRITELLGQLDITDRNLDMLLDVNIKARLDREEELRLESEHAN